MKHLFLASVALLLLAGCGDFNKDLGNGYRWIRANQYSHSIYLSKQRDDGSISYIDMPIDSNVIDVQNFPDTIIAYRIPSQLYDGPSEPEPHYGYHIIDKRTGEVRRSVAFGSVIQFVEENKLDFTWSLCRHEGTIIRCARYLF